MSPEAPQTPPPINPGEVQPVVYRDPAEFATRWVLDILMRADDRENLEQRILLLGRQIINSYGLPTNKEGEIIHTVNREKVYERMRLLSLLLPTAENVDEGERKQALSFADDLAHLVWNEAEREHKHTEIDRFWQKLMKESNEAMHEAATHDPLTGLLNRRGLDEAFIALTETALAGEGVGVAVLVFDLDGFKPVNDRLGHYIGDQVLAGIADFLNDETRRVDVPGEREPDIIVRVREKDEPEEIPETETIRLGGDEFGVLMLLTDEDRVPGKRHTRYARALSLGSRLKKKLKQRTFSTSAGEVGGIGMSMGVAVWKEGMSSGELLHTADLRMYREKRRKAEKVAKAKKKQAQAFLSRLEAHFELVF